MKLILIIGAIAIVVVSAWSYSYTHQPPKTPASPTEIAQYATVSNMSIAYTGGTFTPTSTVSRVPATISIKNMSSKPFLPRMKGGQLTNGQCREGTSYGSCTAVAPGETWTGSFDAPGVYEYYDKLNSSSPEVIIQINPPSPE